MPHGGNNSILMDVNSSCEDIELLLCQQFLAISCLYHKLFKFRHHKGAVSVYELEHWKHVIM